MEKQAIISSGLLELYAAGITSEVETKEVEQWIAQYPEVAIELGEISACLEAYAKGHAFLPGSEVKEKIFARISQAEENKLPASGIIHGNSTPLRRINSFWKMAAAASVVLLIASIVMNIVTYNRYKETDRNLVAVQQNLDTVEERNRIMEAGLNVVRSRYSVPVSLKGLEAAPNAAAKIFWMQNTGEVFIDAGNLPDAPQGKQYQLWGIVDGKPVDGGMITTAEKGDKFRMQKMKSFGRAEAFAVTLEPEKGNLTPLGPMYVMGKM